MSKNSADTSLRIFNSIEHYKLNISRAALVGGLSIAPYLDAFKTDLFLSANEEDVQEATTARCTVDLDMAIRGGCRVKIHAGPGLVKRNGKQDQEVHFIFDQDLFMPGNVPVNVSAGALETLHSQAYAIFRGAITDTLFDAMDPTPV